MIRRALIHFASAAGLAALLAGPAPSSAQGATPAGADPKAAFERLKSLAGTWEGRATDEKTGPPVTVVYRSASNGSVVMEDLFPGTDHEMISIYFLDRGELVMTHYCAMANQPHMRLDGKASTADTLVFGFDGGTNLDPTKDGHIHAGVIRFLGDAVHADWAVWKDGKEVAQNRFFLKRVK
jgi:hypothetical protein